MKTSNTTLANDTIRRQVRECYGEIARRPGGGCCSGGEGPLESPTDPGVIGYTPEDLAALPDGAEMGLGCGNPTAIALIRPGETVVDLGSGGGVDCFLAARQTGDMGRVVGVDMTPEMISRARKNGENGSYDNVEFRLGEIENLPLADGEADLILSNCVINLSPDKPRVFAETWRVLKPGGRLAISDIVTLQPLPDDLREDIEAYTGCIAGAVSPEALKRLLQEAGFRSIRIEVKASSRDFINQWIPGRRAGDYVASASITAVKP